MMLELRNIYKTYLQGKLEVPVLGGISLSVEEGEYLAIMGPSGSGKTTLMNIIGCLDNPTSGDYILGSENIAQISEKRMSEVRLHSIGFVFQSFYLLSRQSALDNVALPLLYAGVRRRERQEIARRALERVGLGDRTNFKPNQLSGGQCQRVAIARAIVNNPKIILADEPTGALDTRSGRQIMEIFQSLNDEGVTIVMITHEPEIAAHAKRTLHIRDGLLVNGAGQPLPSGPAAPGGGPSALPPSGPGAPVPAGSAPRSSQPAGATPPGPSQPYSAVLAGNRPVQAVPSAQAMQSVQTVQQPPASSGLPGNPPPGAAGRQPVPSSPAPGAYRPGGGPGQGIPAAPPAPGPHPPNGRPSGPQAGPGPGQASQPSYGVPAHPAGPQPAPPAGTAHGPVYGRITPPAHPAHPAKPAARPQSPQPVPHAVQPPPPPPTRQEEMPISGETIIAALERQLDQLKQGGASQEGEESAHE